jgi:hypothetical protein
MIAAEILKLRRNRPLMAFAALLSIGAVVLVFGYSALEHATNPKMNGPAGGDLGFSRAVRLGGLFFGALAAALIGGEAGTADVSSGVFRDLVATGRSRWSLFAVRLPAALLVTLALNLTALALGTVLTFALAGGQPTPGAGVIADAFLWLVLANAVVVALAVGVGSLTGSRAVTLTGVIGWQTIATQLLEREPSLGSARDGLLNVALGQLMPVSGGYQGITMAGGIAVAVIAGWFVIPSLLGLRRVVTEDA